MVINIHFQKMKFLLQLLSGSLLFSSVAFAHDVADTYEKNREDIRHDKCIDYQRELDKVNIRLESLRNVVSEEQQFLVREQKRILEEIKYYCD